MIINVRGGHGSGKSTIGRWFIDNHKHVPLHSPNFRTDRVQKPVSFHLEGDLFVLGRYQPGGDGIRFDPLEELIRGFAKVGHVLFENVLVSGNVPRFLRLRAEMPEIDWVWATLDTPEDLCIERIYARNGGKPIKEDTTRGHHRRVLRLAEQLEAMPDQHTVTLDHTGYNAINQVHALLVEGGWNCGTHGPSA